MRAPFARFVPQIGMDTGRALMEALLLGRLEGLSPETIFLFARTGVLHLFSASGFHMAAAAQIALACAGGISFFLPRGRSSALLAFAMQLTLMFYFGCVTSWNSPMVRAFTYTTLLAGARAAELRPSTQWVFLLSLATAWFGGGSFLSYALSALGMLGVLYARPRSIWSLLFGPWLTTLPLVLWSFGTFSLASPLWNLLYASSVSFVVMPLAIAHLLLRPLALAADPTLTAAAWLMDHLTAALAWGDDWVGLGYWVSFPVWAPLAIGLGGVVWLAELRRWRLAVTLGCGAIFAAGVLPNQPRLAALDVGQGDAIFLRTNTDERVLVDVGPRGFRGREARVNRALSRAGVGALDEVVLTHLDADHVGGLADLLRARRVRGATWLREELVAEAKAEPLLAALERAEVPLRFLSEERAPSGFTCRLTPAWTSNDASPLCRAQLARGGAIWLTGDLSEEAETWFLARARALPPAEFLKVGHHGSASSSSTAFLRASRARTALVSVGRRNRYRHPRAEVLSRLRKNGMEVRRTDEEGTISFY